MPIKYDNLPFWAYTFRRIISDLFGCFCGESWDLDQNQQTFHRKNQYKFYAKFIFQKHIFRFRVVAYKKGMLQICGNLTNKIHTSYSNCCYCYTKTFPALISVKMSKVLVLKKYSRALIEHRFRNLL